MQKTPATRARRWWHSPAWVGVIAFALYAQTLQFGLVNFDDPWLIRDNVILNRPSLKHFFQVWGDFSRPVRLQLGSEYLPVRDTSVMLDHLLFGRWFSGHHLTNVLLYSLLCSLLALAVCCWTGSPSLAWAVGLLYATHPTHVESVAWLSERKGLLAGVGVFAATLTFSRFFARPTLLRWVWTALALAFAIWSKAIALVAVAALAALAWVGLAANRSCSAQQQPQRRTRLGLGIAALGILSGLVFLPVWQTGSAARMVSGYHGGSFGRTAWLMAQVHALYLKHLAWGGPLAITYPLEATADNVLLSCSGILGLLLIVAVALLGLLKRGAWAIWGFAALWWLIFLAPVSQLLTPLQNFIADRYLLLPSLSGCLVFALLLNRLRQRSIHLVLLGLLVAFAATMTFLQTRTWADSESLFRQAHRVAPENVEILLRLAQIHRKRAQAGKAWKLLRKAQRLEPNNSRVPFHQALLLAEQGQLKQAQQAYRRAAEMDPLADQARANLALLLLAEGKLDEALRWAAQAVRIQPERALNHRTLGLVKLRLGQAQEALQHFQTAQALAPHNEKIAANIRTVRRMLRQHRSSD